MKRERSGREKGEGEAGIIGEHLRWVEGNLFHKGRCSLKGGGVRGLKVPRGVGKKCGILGFRIDLGRVLLGEEVVSKLVYGKFGLGMRGVNLVGKD